MYKYIFNVGFDKIIVISILTPHYVGYTIVMCVVIVNPGVGGGDVGICVDVSIVLKALYPRLKETSNSPSSRRRSMEIDS